MVMYSSSAPATASGARGVASLGSAAACAAAGRPTGRAARRAQASSTSMVAPAVLASGRASRALCAGQSHLLQREQSNAPVPPLRPRPHEPADGSLVARRPLVRSVPRGPLPAPRPLPPALPQSRLVAGIEFAVDGGGCGGPRSLPPALLRRGCARRASAALVLAAAALGIVVGAGVGGFVAARGGAGVEVLIR